ncbi:MAG: aspartyl protease family protein [Acidobacteria bacterium]|nr:aspartyl protease family protein [Acidobacteriota bacterium]MBI3425177.1 aspartyl protease family protein [Acidobacteriota bacterium]
MKTALRLSLLALALLLVVPSAWAQNRNKTFKRAEDEVRKGNLDLAEKTYRELLALDDKDKAARLGLSFVLLKQSKLQESYDLATAVLAVEPVNARAHSLIGTALLRSGEFRTSVEALFTALKLNEREALAYAGLAEIEYFENRARNAYDGLRKAISLEPNEPDYYVSLARACSRLEQYSEAADAYQRYLEVSPKSDIERRERIRGLIAFYRYLGSTKIHRAAGKEASSVKFDLVRYRPFVNVMVNGKGPLRFVVDTGASLSVISDEAAARLGIKPVARGGKARAVGGSGTFPIVYGLLDSMQLGEVRIEAIPVYIRTVHHADDAPASERADGYIGLSMLANYLITIDYQKRELTLDRHFPQEQLAQTETSGQPATPTSPAPPLANPVPGGDVIAAIIGTEVPIRSTSGGLASAETILPRLDRPLNFIIDTGATTTVISKATVARHQLEDLKIAGETYRVIGAAGIEEGAEALGLSALTVSGLRKSNSRALILDLGAVNETSGFEQHGILGGDYLSHFLVRIDLRRYSMKLTPQSKAISVADGKQ